MIDLELKPSSCMNPERSIEQLARFTEISYGYVPGAFVLEDVSIDVRRGEVLSLIGPSGCGKTTLLHMLAGLIKPWSGNVQFNGVPLTTYNTDVGYMTQEDTLLPWRSVWNNVALPLRLRATPRSEVESRVNSFLEMLNLLQAAKKFPSQLSGGMKRRALMARSMIYQPKMLLMDEPFSALDAPMRESLQGELRRIVESLNQTVLFVTHDVTEAILISDRIAVIGGGPPASLVSLRDIPFGNNRELSTLATSDAAVELQRLIRDDLLCAGKQIPQERNQSA
jgi:NitT/TauT family transport system ATP-binding protein